MEQTPSELGRALGSLQRRERKVCAQCGKEFEGLKRAKYCSHVCVVAAYWARNREKLNAARRERYRRQKEGD